MSIFSLMPYGNGAFILHEQLTENIDDYHLKSIGPIEASFPRLLFRHQVDTEIVHSCPDLGPWIAKKGQKYVVTFHNYYFDNYVKKYASIPQFLFYQTILKDAVINSVKRSDHITAVSTFLADIIMYEFKCTSKKISVIQNGVDHSCFVPANKHDTDEIIILFAGNPTKRKGKDVLIAVANELPPNSCIQYTSDLRYSTMLPKISGLKSLPSRPHNEMPSLYQESDIFFFPSFREGQGLVILEAMASGLPVVTTNLRPMSDFVDHGKGGYLFEAGNSKEALKFLKKLIDDKSLREEMGTYNRSKVVSEYSLGKMITEYKDLFHVI